MYQITRTGWLCSPAGKRRASVVEEVREPGLRLPPDAPCPNTSATKQINSLSINVKRQCQCNPVNYWCCNDCANFTYCMGIGVTFKVQCLCWFLFINVSKYFQSHLFLFNFQYWITVYLGSNSWVQDLNPNGTKVPQRTREASHVTFFFFFWKYDLTLVLVYDMYILSGW